MATARLDTPPVILVDSVSKAFTMPEERMHTLKERALHPFREIRQNTLTALRDVSCDVRRGEFFGIAGRNGSGKSTLLKCMAGIYGVDAGEIRMDGRISTFIELGVGFNADLAARDNVVMNGIMMGLSPREAKARYDSVIDFAELREFQDLKLKNYSSGMNVRLAFSVAVQVDADILLIDEVLAVGDASFQQKCFDVFHRMRKEGKTIVFVTHDMSSLNRFCHRAMLLERGDRVYLGDPEAVADRYLELNFGRAAVAEGAARPRGDGDARVLEAWVEDADGARTGALAQGKRATLKARVAFMRDVEDPAASVYVHNEDHQAVIVASTVLSVERSGCFRAGEVAIFGFSFENVLRPGRYSPVFQLAHHGQGLDVMDRFEGSFTFAVTGVRALGGMVDVPVDVAVERVSEPAPFAAAGVGI